MNSSPSCQKRNEEKIFSALICAAAIGLVWMHGVAMLVIFPVIYIACFVGAGFSPGGYSALAAGQGWNWLMKLCLKLGADASDSTRTPSLIDLAIISDNEAVARTLLEHGADLNSAWGTVIYSGSHITPLMLKLGADPTTEVFGEPLMHYASSVEMYDALIAAGCPADTRSSYGSHPLHHCGEESLIEHLLANGQDPNVVDTRGATPLHYSLGQPCDETKRLLAHGADPNWQDQRGCTPVHLAIEDPDRLSVLLEAGGDTELRDLRGRRPLFYAVHFGIADSVIQLRPANSQDLDGYSPLHWAAAQGDLSICKALIKGGAEISADSPLHLALLHGHRRV
ncbi:MAG: ankyrin repeat protein [Rhodothermales bacterium]|jgi:ankyrin repeat protein